MSKKIFSGVQPTGNLHLGNYIGAIKNFVDLQNQNNNECVYCVVDLHAVTTKQDPNILRRQETGDGPVPTRPCRRFHQPRTPATYVLINPRVGRAPCSCPTFY